MAGSLCQVTTLAITSGLSVLMGTNWLESHVWSASTMATGLTHQHGVSKTRVTMISFTMSLCEKNMNEQEPISYLKNSKT